MGYVAVDFDTVRVVFIFQLVELLFLSLFCSFQLLDIRLNLQSTPRKEKSYQLPFLSYEVGGINYGLFQFSAHTCCDFCVCIAHDFEFRFH